MGVIYLDRLLPAGSAFRQATYPPALSGPDTSIFGLAGGGVCPAGAVADAAVRSYRTISPLPFGCVFSVALSRGLPRVAVSHHRCPILLGLSSPHFSVRSDRPTRSLKSITLTGTPNQYNKNWLYFPEDTSMCFLNCSSSVSGKSLLKCTPLLSRLVLAARAISRQTVSIFWHSQPAGPSKTLSIT